MKPVVASTMFGSWLVAPRRGAWIETVMIRAVVTMPVCRTPQGCVD